MKQAPEEISVADPDLDPETWLDQYGDYLYQFALARIRDKVSETIGFEKRNDGAFGYLLS